LVGFVLDVPWLLIGQRAIVGGGLFDLESKMEHPAIQSATPRSSLTKSDNQYIYIISMKKMLLDTIGVIPNLQNNERRIEGAVVDCGHGSQWMAVIVSTTCMHGEG